MASFYVTLLFQLMFGLEWPIAFESLFHLRLAEGILLLLVVVLRFLQRLRGRILERSWCEGRGGVFERAHVLPGYELHAVFPAELADEELDVVGDDDQIAHGSGDLHIGEGGVGVRAMKHSDHALFDRHALCAVRGDDVAGSDEFELRILIVEPYAPRDFFAACVPGRDFDFDSYECG